MTNFKDSLSQAARDSFCKILSANINYLNKVNNLFAPLPAPGSIPAATLRLMSRMLCNREPPSVPGGGFTGGQCSTRYHVIVEYENVASNYNVNPPVCYRQPPSVAQGVVWGAIGGLRFSMAEPGGVAGTPCNGVTVYKLIELWCRGIGGNPGEGQWIPFIQNAPVATARIASVQRLDGLPDDCGNLPAPVPPVPHGGTKVNTNVVYIDNSNNSVNVGATFTFAFPYIEVNGVVNIPFTLNLEPDVSFTGTINQNGDVVINIGGGSGSGQPPMKDPRKGDCDEESDPVSPPPPVPLIPPSPLKMKTLQRESK